MKTQSLREQRAQEIKLEAQKLKEEKESLRDQGEAELDRIRESYESQKSAEQDRYEKSLQSTRLQSYENLRNTKRKTEEEARKLEDASRRSLDEKKYSLAENEKFTLKDGQKRVQEARKKYNEALKIEESKSKESKDLARALHVKSAEQIQKESTETLKNLEDQKQGFLHQQKTQHGKAIHQIEDHYTRLRSDINQRHRSETNALQDYAHQDLEHRKETNAQYLDQFSQMKADPFYRGTRIPAQFYEQDQEVLIQLKIPAHEKSNFKVQVSGQEVQITGVRSHDETQTLAPGHFASTQSYQTVTERIPLSMPVDSKTLERIDLGDEGLLFRMKKYGPQHRYYDSEQSIRKDERDLVRELEFSQSIPRPQNFLKRVSKT